MPATAPGGGGGATGAGATLGAATRGAERDTRGWTVRSPVEVVPELATRGAVVGVAVGRGAGAGAGAGAEAVAARANTCVTQTRPSSLVATPTPARLKLPRMLARWVAD